MWARIVEFMLALWLAISPFIFHYPGNQIFLWINDFVCAFFLILFALFSHMYVLRKLHLAILLISLWLTILAFSQTERPFPPAYQNYFILSVFLAMLAIVPSEADLPPHPWRNFYEK